MASFPGRAVTRSYQDCPNSMSDMGHINSMVGAFTIRKRQRKLFESAADWAEDRTLCSNPDDRLQDWTVGTAQGVFCARANSFRNIGLG